MANNSEDAANKLESEFESKMSLQEAPYDKDWLKGTSAEYHLSTIDTSASANDFSHPIYKTIAKLNGKINNMSFKELVQALRELKLDSSGKKEVLVKRLKTYQKQLHLKRDVNQYQQQTKKVENDFDYVCVIDYEATCTGDNTKPNYPHEIIEFPIVLINMKTREIEDHFQEYCKPIINPKLSDFCIHLTGITQDKVDSADTFQNVLNKVTEWFMTKQLGTKYKFAIATDGPWDCENFLNLQCLHSQIEYPYWATKWVDVRKMFSNWFNVRRCGIKKMLNYIGMDFEGQQHCGLDDAKNISRILLKLVNDGCVLKCNERIRDCHMQISKNPFKTQTNKKDDDCQVIQNGSESSEDSEANEDMEC